MNASARRLEAGRLVIASHNAGKVREIGELLSPYGVEPVSAGDLGLPSPPETEDTFEGNARIKALAAATGAEAPALADDSGLEIDALGGAPGVYAADWAQTTHGRDFDVAMRRVWREIERSGAASPFKARFICVLCLAWPDGVTRFFRGAVEGEICWPPRGDKGFGYDPIFIRAGEDRTFGEIDSLEKHANSHRSHAFEKLIAAGAPPERFQRKQTRYRGPKMR